MTDEDKVIATMASIAQSYGVNIFEIVAKRRDRKALTDARRHIAWELCRMGYSTTEVGKYMQRHHTNVIYNRDQHQWRLDRERKQAANNR